MPTHGRAVIYIDSFIAVYIKTQFGMFSLIQEFHTPNGAAQRFNRWRKQFFDLQFLSIQ